MRRYSFIRCPSSSSPSTAFVWRIVLFMSSRVSFRLWWHATQRVLLCYEYFSLQMTFTWCVGGTGRSISLSPSLPFPTLPRDRWIRKQTEIWIPSVRKMTKILKNRTVPCHVVSFRSSIYCICIQLLCVRWMSQGRWERKGDKSKTDGCCLFFSSSWLASQQPDRFFFLSK